MKLIRRTIALDGNASVSAVVAYPPQFVTGQSTAVILAHGAGNDMESPFLCAVHEGLAQRGFVAVKFNFPYKERGGRAPDPARVLEGCYTRVLETIRTDATIAAPRIVIGGKSLGGRMASHLAAKGAEVAALLFLGYPLHPPGKVDRLRTAHLDAIQVPMLFFAGTRDSLSRFDLLQSTIDHLRQRGAAVQLHVIEGGDHSFDVLKSMRRSRPDVWNEIISASAAWLATLA